MNSNLRRVLTLALTFAVLAVNFTIPAMAAADITVSYADLPTDILGQANANLQQGILFYDTTPGASTNAGAGVDSQANKNTDYAPLEVWKSTRNASLNMQASEWVKYTVTAAEAGYYSVGMKYGSVVADLEFIIRTDSDIVVTALPRSGGAYTWKTVSDLGYLYLNAGANDVYVQNADDAAYVNFNELYFTKDDSADVTMITMLKPAASVNEIGNFTIDPADGYNTIDVVDATVTFSVTIPEDGKYKVSLRGIAGTSNSVSVDFGGDAKNATVSNTEYADTSIGVFPLLAGAYTMTVTGLADYQLAWVTVDYISPYQTQVVTESFSDGDTVTRGTDSLVIEFNDTMAAVDAATQVTLQAGTETVPVAVDVVDKTVTVSFLETLDYETPYTLTLTALSGVNDNEPMADKVYSFTTGNSDSDGGTATVSITDVVADYEAMTVEGTVLGSTGKGIKGRTVSISNPDGVEVATATSGDDGVFTLSFTIPDGTVAGTYIYNTITEYSTATNTEIPYVSQAEEQRILGLFKSATTATAVADIFTSYYEILRAPNYATDMGTLSDTDLFHNHFAQKEFSRVSDFATYYSKMLLLEQMNQATLGSYVYSNFINQKTVCETLGFDMDKWVLLNNDSLKNEVSTVFVGLPTATSEETFYDRYEEAVDKVLLKEAGVLDASYNYSNTLDITGYTTSLNYGGEISIPLKLTVPQTNVSKITVTVTVSAGDAGNLANAQTVIGDARDTSVSVSGNTATFQINYNYVAGKSYSDLGRLALQGSVLGAHTFDVNADVTYRIEKTVSNEVKAVELTLPVTGGSFSATVGTTPTDTGRDTGSIGDGGYVAPPKEIEKEEDNETTSVYFFDDMAEAIWAQDMVHSLVGRGVISQNAERAFRPMDNVTREEFVKMIVTVIGSHNQDAVSSLSDVGANHWATSYIATAQDLGIVQGNADGTFGIGTNITRQDMAVMIYRTFKMLGIDLTEGSAAFQDSNEISDYAKTAVSALEKQGIINGMGDNTFAPAANATRAQAAKVIYVMMEVLGV